MAIPELSYKNSGKSKAKGSVRDGQLENAYLIPYSGKNFRYFSPLSYYLLNNGYTHSSTCQTVLDAYKICETTCPGIQFRIMECSDKKGGKLLIHRTHQNGTSVDFMVPKKKKSKQSTFWDHLGMWHYLLEFNNQGQLNVNKNVAIDFETIGKHILALDDSARKNGMRIKKIILKIELKDDLYKTPSGKKVKARGIYVVQGLTPIVNKVHDDHYHVDFVFLK